MRDGVLSYVHNLAGWRTYRVDAAIARPADAHTLGFRFTRTEGQGGRGELLVDNEVVGTADIKRVTPIRYSLTGVGFWCGRGGNLAVCDAYEGPFPYTGRLDRVEISVRGPEHIDAAAEAEIAIATQ